MAPPEAQDTAARDRIIKHMNADHHDSVRRYLEVSDNPWFYELRDAKMTDIDVNAMKFSYAKGQKKATVPFDPPLKSLKEARERLVALDKESLKTLERSDITVTKFVPPYTRLPHLFNWLVCLTTYIMFARLSNFKPGSLAYDNLLFQFPAFSDFCITIRPFLFWIMVAIHAFEAGIMQTRLEEHGVKPDKGIWWAWVGTCFIEGITSKWRFDSLIASTKKEKEIEAKKH